MAEDLERHDRSSAESQDKGEALTLRPDYSAVFPTFYANFAVISHTPEDLSIDFCLAAPPLNVNVQEKTVAIPLVVRVIIPSGMAEGLINALRTQLDKQKGVKESGMMLVQVQRKEPDTDD